MTTNFIKRSDYILLSMLPFWKCVILTDVPFEPKVLFSSTCVSVGSSKSKVTLYDIVLLPVITSVTPTRPRFLMLVRLLSACWRFFAVMLFTNTGAIFSPPYLTENASVQLVSFPGKSIKTAPKILTSSQIQCGSLKQ